MEAFSKKLIGGRPETLKSNAVLHLAASFAFPVLC